MRNAGFGGSIVWGVTDFSFFGRYRDHGWLVVPNGLPSGTSARDGHAAHGLCVGCAVGISHRLYWFHGGKSAVFFAGPIFLACTRHQVRSHTQQHDINKLETKKKSKNLDGEMINNSRWIAGDKHLTAIKHSLALGGFKLIFLLRIGPFPFRSP